MSDTPITKLSSLDITPDPHSKYNGFYLPQLTNLERNAIPADAVRNGGLIYNITTHKINAYVNGEWLSLATAPLNNNIILEGPGKFTEVLKNKVKK